MFSLKTLFNLLVFLLIIAGFAWLVLKDAANPMVREAIERPVFAVGEDNEDTRAALAEGRQIVKFGPLLLGAYPGGMAFDSVESARAYIDDGGEPLRRYAVYELSGDMAEDTKLSDGHYRLVRSLVVLRQVDRLRPANTGADVEQSSSQNPVAEDPIRLSQ